MAASVEFMFLLKAQASRTQLRLLLLPLDLPERGSVSGPLLGRIATTDCRAFLCRQAGKFPCWEKREGRHHTATNRMEGSGAGREAPLSIVRMQPHAQTQKTSFEEGSVTHKRHGEKTLFSSTATSLSDRSPKELLKYSTYLWALKWSWSLWETGPEPQWLACLRPLQPSVYWQFSIPLVTRIKERSLDVKCMLILFFSVLYLAEPICATSPVSTSIVIHWVSHKSLGYYL